jgi:hypothetical protein
VEKWKVTTAAAADSPDDCESRNKEREFFFASARPCTYGLAVRERESGVFLNGEGQTKMSGLACVGKKGGGWFEIETAKMTSTKTTTLRDQEAACFLNRSNTEQTCLSFSFSLSLSLSLFVLPFSVFQKFKI